MQENELKSQELKIIKKTQPKRKKHKKGKNSPKIPTRNPPAPSKPRCRKSARGDSPPPRSQTTPSSHHRPQNSGLILRLGGDVRGINSPPPRPPEAPQSCKPTPGPTSLLGCGGAGWAGVGEGGGGGGGGVEMGGCPCAPRPGSAVVINNRGAEAGCDNNIT